MKVTNTVLCKADIKCKLYFNEFVTSKINYLCEYQQNVCVIFL